MSRDLPTLRKDRIIEAKNLPALPKVLDEITRLLDNPNVSTQMLADAITRDQAITAKLLRMVNSPVYGISGRIASISHAIALLGMNVIRGVIIGTSVLDLMNRTMSGLWDHGLGCSLACSILAAEQKLDKPEEYAVAGLLHDVGKAVWAYQLPDLFKDVEHLVRSQDLSFVEAEQRILGFTHETVNLWIGYHWHLPLNLRDGMAWHHRPFQAQEHPDVAAVVHIADFCVRICEFGRSGDTHAPRLDPVALEILGLTLDDLDPVLLKILITMSKLNSQTV